MGAHKGLLPLHGRAARAAAHGEAALTTALPQAGSGRAIFPTFQQRARLVDERGAATALEPRPNQHAHLLGVAVGGETIIGCSAAGGQRARQGAGTPQGATCSTAWHLLPDTRAQPAVGRAVPAEGSLEWRRLCPRRWNPASSRPAKAARTWGGCGVGDEDEGVAPPRQLEVRGRQVQEWHGDLAPAHQQLIVCRHWGGADTHTLGNAQRGQQAWRACVLFGTRAKRVSPGARGDEGSKRRERALGWARRVCAQGRVTRVQACRQARGAMQAARTAEWTNGVRRNKHAANALHVAARLGPQAPPPAASRSTPCRGHAPEGAAPPPTRCCAAARPCTAAPACRRCPVRSCGPGGAGAGRAGGHRGVWIPAGLTSLRACRLQGPLPQGLLPCGPLCPAVQACRVARCARLCRPRRGCSASAEQPAHLPLKQPSASRVPGVGTSAGGRCSQCARSELTAWPHTCVWGTEQRGAARRGSAGAGAGRPLFAGPRPPPTPSWAQLDAGWGALDVNRPSQQECTSAACSTGRHPGCRCSACRGAWAGRERAEVARRRKASAGGGDSRCRTPTRTHWGGAGKTCGVGKRAATAFVQSSPARTFWLHACNCQHTRAPPTQRPSAQGLPCAAGCAAQRQAAAVHVVPPGGT